MGTSMCAYLVRLSRDPIDCSPQAPLSMQSSRQVDLGWVAILFSGIFPTQGSNPGSPALQADSLLSEPLGKPFMGVYTFLKAQNCVVKMGVFGDFSDSPVF